MQSAPAGMDPNDPQHLLGFPLMQGERLVFAKRPSFGGDKAALWLFGILLAPVLLGFLFIYLAVTVERRKPSLFAITTWRFVAVSGAGVPASYWFRDFVDVDPERANVNAGGGGLIGGLISAAVTAGMDALAARNQKADPKYWARTIGLVFTDHRGTKVTVPTEQEGQLIGPWLVRVFLMGLADQTPSFDPRAIPPKKLVPAGRGLQVVGVAGAIVLPMPALILIAQMFRFGGGPSVYNYAVGGMMVLGAVAFVIGTFQAVASGKSMGQPASPVLGLVLFTLFFGGAGFQFYRATFDRGGDDDPYVKSSAYGGGDDTAGSEKKKKKKASTSGSASAAATPPPPGDSTAKGLSVAGIEGMLTRRGVKFDPAKPPTGPEIEADWNPSDFASIYYWESPPDRVEDGTAHACKLTAVARVCIDLVGAKDPAAEAKALVDLIASRPVTRIAQIQATLQTKGFKPGSEGVDADGYTFSFSRVLAFAVKGELDLTVQVVDFTEAAQGKKQSAVRMEGNKLVVLSDEYGPPGRVAEIAAEIVKR